MTERNVRFNFPKRRAELVEQKLKVEEQKQVLKERKESEAEILLKAVRTHFSTEEFTASRDRATVRIERRATGNVAFVRMLDDGRFGVTTQDDLTIKLRGGEELTMDKELDEQDMMAWVLDWSEA